tara:strand:+ start:2104 stop:3072 length:969 start_codon:yes stop_codon:yes gene_type:complete
METTILNILNNYEVLLETNNNEDSILNIPTYIINVIHNKYRRSYIKYITSKLKISYTLVVVKPCDNEMKKTINSKSSNGVVGCCLSHLWCIKNAIENNYKHFLILEDDVVFHKDFKYLFSKVNYQSYDMIQLGCCDFNLKRNIISKPTSPFSIYSPKYLALGAYGNIYNLDFAKLFFYEKICSFKEFDTTFDNYYEKYNIGICYPNLLTTELSTSDLGHNYSLFKNNKSKFNYNNYFTSMCFFDFNYNSYDFLWIEFVSYCYMDYTKKNTMLDINTYNLIINNFSEQYPDKKELIQSVLLNNSIDCVDMNQIIIDICNDKYM